MRGLVAALVSLSPVAVATVAACRDTAEARYELPSHDLAAAPVGGQPIGGGDPRFDAYVRDLGAAAERNDRAELVRLLPAGALIETWMAALPTDGRVSVHVVGRARLGGATLAVLELALDRDRAVGELDFQTFELRVHGVLAAGVERLTWPTPADLAPIERGAIEGDVFVWGFRVRADLTVTLPVRPTGPFALGAIPPAAPGSELAVELSQDGRPCRFVRFGDATIIEPAVPGSPHLRIRYDGVPPADIADDGEGMTIAARWTGVGEATWVRLAIHHAPVSLVRSSVPALPQWRRFPGWRTTELRGASATIPLWLVPDRPRRRERWTVDAGIVDIEAPTGQLASWRPLVERAASALEPLGPFPRGTVPIVVLPAFDKSMLVGDTLALAAMPGVATQQQIEVVTHELAHVWFGGLIGARVDVSTKWWEAVAEYLAQWALSEREALAFRAERLRRLADTPAMLEAPSAPASAVSNEVAAALSYSRGALVLSGLEARVGRPAMVRWLGHLARQRAGVFTGMPELVATVEESLGADQARWLRGWLETAGPAAVHVEGTMVRDGRLVGELVAHLPEPIDQRVAVAFVDHAGRRRSEASVVLVGPRTAFALPIPDGATHLVLNSDAMLPLRGLDGGADDGLARFIVPLVADAGETPPFVPP